MAQTIKCTKEAVIMVITDEVEQVARVKIRHFLTCWYAEICQRKVYLEFQCEGCEKYWCSQRDHECCLKTEHEIFEDHYDDIKNEVSLDMLHEVCEQLTKAADIPMTSEWDLLICQLANMSSHLTCTLWLEMVNADGEEEKMYDVIKNLCNCMDGSSQLDSELFSWFIEYLQR